MAVATALGAGLVTTIGASPASASSGLAKWSYDGTQFPINAAKDAVDAEKMAKYFGSTGKGVGIALIDTGVAPVPGLTGGNVVNGPDLSFESQDETKRYRDTYGHGTHLAGIIAARPTSKKDAFKGIAPGAKLTSIKVAGANGAVDVSQVIAAIDWVVAHRNYDKANPIRVLSLAYGTDAVQSHEVDPLSHAVENAWRAGITVVVAGGNDGAGARLVNPAHDPYVIAVGAMDSKGTGEYSDDTVADFSSRGTSDRRIDLIAPGRSLVSLRAPGSSIDTEFPGARVDTRFFKGSGSSQASALTAGAVALMLEERPSLTPDRIKQMLKARAYKLVANAPADADIGLLDVYSAFVREDNPEYPPVAQTFPRSKGTGSLEAARGSAHVYDGTVPLTGENDLFGSFSTATWATATTNQTAWIGGNWMGRSVTGTGWATSSTGLLSWNGRYWSGCAWSGRYWSAGSWSSQTWLGRTWS